MRTDEQFIDQYQVLERIGSGGMADVYRARHLTKCEPDVALKVIRADCAENPHVLRRFHREVYALSRLSHPHILSPLAWGEAAGSLYLVLPWIREGTLSQLLQARGGFLPVEEALPLFEQLCAAVQYAHEQGIIHRDIKPHNVLVRDFTHVFLTDFGIALDDLDTRLTTTGGALGSVTYMAPEQAMGQPTARSDLYSLGIVLYQLLTGVVPFLGDSPLQVLLQHALIPPADPRQFQPSLPPGLVQMLQKALAKDPGTRFESAQKFWDAVQPFEGASSRLDLSAVAPLGDGPGRQWLITARKIWAEWPEDQASDLWERDTKINQNPLLKPASLRQETQPAPGLQPRQPNPSAHHPGHLSVRQKGLLGGVMTLAFLLLLGSAALGLSQPRLATQHPGSAQAAPQPTATRPAVPTTGPSSPPVRTPGAQPPQQAGNEGQRGSQDDDDGGKGRHGGGDHGHNGDGGMN